MSVRIEPITAADDLAFIERRGWASFLQTPAWAQVKPEWTSDLVGWYAGDELVGAGLVLYRSMPRIGRSLAYLPEGPVLDWEAADVTSLLDSLVAYVKTKGAFAVRIGPTITWRTWHAETIKKAIADDDVHRISDVEPDALNAAATRLRAQLLHHRWLPPRSGPGFAPGQPDFNFQLPLAGKTEEQLLAGMNQLWRRNIKKAAKEGVEVSQGDRSDLVDFHRLYLETAARDGFRPRQLPYFEVMWDALRAEDPDRIRLYLARYQGVLVAAATWVKVGDHVWYSYGASSTQHREVRGSNAMQWQMIRDARDAGAAVYDLRGITEGVSADDPEVGLISFKVGTGGEVVQYLGEWDRPINRPLYLAFGAYLRRGELRKVAAAAKSLVRRRPTTPSPDQQVTSSTEKQPAP